MVIIGGVGLLALCVGVHKHQTRAAKRDGTLQKRFQASEDPTPGSLFAGFSSGSDIRPYQEAIDFDSSDQFGLQLEAGMHQHNQGWHLRCCPTKRTCRLVGRLSFQPARMLITYAQIVSQLGGVLRIEFPRLFTYILDMIRPFLEVLSFGLSAECIGLGGFVRKWAFRVVMIPLVLLLLAAANYWRQRRQPGNDDAAKLHLKTNLFFITFFCCESHSCVHICARTI